MMVDLLALALDDDDDDDVSFLYHLSHRILASCFKAVCTDDDDDDL